MKRENRFRIGLVVFLVVAALWSLWPTIRVIMLGEEGRARMAQDNPAAWQELRNQAIALGLDLRGGMHLVMEIDLEAIPEDGRRDAQERFVSIIRNRVDQYGISEPTIQPQGERRVVVELAGVDDPEQARDLVGRTAVLSYNFLQSADVVGEIVSRINGTLYEGLVSGEVNRRSIGLHIVQPEADSGLDLLAGGDTTAAAADSLRIPEDPLNLYLFGTPQSPNVLWAREDRMAWVDSILALPRVQAVVPSNSEFHWGMWSDPRFVEPDGTGYRELYITETDPVVTGNNLRDASVTIGSPQDPDAAGQPVVNFQMDSEGGRMINRGTRSRINERMAIVLDGRVAVAPEIKGALGASSRITGINDMNEAQSIAIVLRSGALPAPARIVENRTIGPSLGLDSIKSGVISMAVGLILVVIFMVAYYRGSGLIADTALFLNVLFILAVLAGFNFTLTLPGIAGIILTMGMAVDANVLIYDRIKEELRAGKTVRASVDAGYANARSAILDANITTLITAIVLYQFGTGPIRGFALTLSVGIVSSVFTALIVTRLIFDGILGGRAVEKLSI